MKTAGEFVRLWSLLRGTLGMLHIVLGMQQIAFHEGIEGIGHPSTSVRNSADLQCVRAWTVPTII